MKKSKSHNGSFIAAVVTACVLLIGFSVTYKVLAHSLDASSTAEPLPPEALEALPMQLGDWIGEDSPLSQEIINKTDTDARISRTYSRNNGAESVWSYVAYGVQARDLLPHRPEVCYEVAGWKIDVKETIELPVEDSSPLQCQYFVFSRGILKSQKVVLLNYYIVDGEYSSDVSLLRSKLWRGAGAIEYVVQVELVCSVGATFNLDDAEQSVKAFAVDSAKEIYKLFENDKVGTETGPSHKK